MSLKIRQTNFIYPGSSLCDQCVHWWRLVLMYTANNTKSSQCCFQRESVSVKCWNYFENNPENTLLPHDFQKQSSRNGSVGRAADPIVLYYIWTNLVFWFVDVNGTNHSKCFLCLVIEGPWLVHFSFQPKSNAAMFTLKRSCNTSENKSSVLQVFVFFFLSTTAYRSSAMNWQKIF